MGIATTLIPRDQEVLILFFGKSADIEQVHLAGSFMDGVDADEAIVARPVGMQNTAGGAGIGWSRVKGSDFVRFPVA